MSSTVTGAATRWHYLTLEPLEALLNDLFYAWIDILYYETILPFKWHFICIYN